MLLHGNGEWFYIIDTPYMCIDSGMYRYSGIIHIMSMAALTRGGGTLLSEPCPTLFDI